MATVLHDAPTALPRHLPTCLPAYLPQPVHSLPLTCLPLTCCPLTCCPLTRCPLTCCPLTYHPPSVLSVSVAAPPSDMDFLEPGFEWGDVAFYFFWIDVRDVDQDAAFFYFAKFCVDGCAEHFHCWREVHV